MSDGEVEAAFLKHFQKPPQELYSHWDPVPFAGGAIGQVHKATLKSGEIVSVKVKYPGIAKTIKNDFSAIKKIAPLVNIFFSNIDLLAQVRQWESRTLIETDYRVEESNLSEFGSSMPKEICEIPKTYPEYCGPSILTSEFVDGQRLEDFIIDSDQDKCDEIGRDLFLSTYQMILDKKFRLDIHMGNYLVRENKLVMIDFGVIGDLNKTKTNHLTVMDLVIAGDSAGLKSYLEAANWTKDLPIAIAEKFVKIFGEPFSGEVFKFDQQYVSKLLDFLMKDLGNYARMPDDSIYVLRIVGSMYNLLAQLECKGNWREISAPFHSSSKTLLKTS